MLKRIRRVGVAVIAMAAVAVPLGLAPTRAQASSPTATSNSAPTEMTTAAAQWNSIGFTVRSNATWTPEPRPPRYKGTYGNIVLNLTDNVDGGTYVRLLDRNGNVFAGPVYWPGGTYGQKTVATNVRGGTYFTVEARKGSTRGTNNYWGGYMYY